ncbi:MULE domain-containing protein [Aphis craccivora]|uniref:MULE domain-containing protein n=1 Tax=Aphis craccivora TaxID=307492 RepID=A0A6G0YCG8_APHCR|nr:MULE domain-containing protein [Aphis craccivora]
MLKFISVWVNTYQCDRIEWFADKWDESYSTNFICIGNNVPMLSITSDCLQRPKTLTFPSKSDLVIQKTKFTDMIPNTFLFLPVNNFSYRSVMDGNLNRVWSNCTYFSQTALELKNGNGSTTLGTSAVQPLPVKPECSSTITFFQVECNSTISFLLLKSFILLYLIFIPYYILTNKYSSLFSNNNHFEIMNVPKYTLNHLFDAENLDLITHVEPPKRTELTPKIPPAVSTVNSTDDQEGTINKSPNFLSLIFKLLYKTKDSEIKPENVPDFFILNLMESKPDDDQVIKFTGKDAVFPPDM